MTAGAAVLRLKRDRDRPRVHPWIFKGDVADVGDVVPGTAVTVIDPAGQFVGRGFYNPRPALCARILTRRDEPLDGPFFRRRLAEALALRGHAVDSRAQAGDVRARTGRPSTPPRRSADSEVQIGDEKAQASDSKIPTRGTPEGALDDAPAESGEAPGGARLIVPTAGRLVWSEADFLPGLVVDRYGHALVVQCQTLGMAGVRPVIVAALRALVGNLPVLDMDEDMPAALEGFTPARGWRDRPGPNEVIVAEGAVRLRVALGAGHKTGLYLDQAENRQRAAALARGQDVLDAFSYTAGFACHAFAAGARRAVCLESAPDAIAGARDNLALNGVADRAEIRAVNAFDELRRLERSRERFGLVVLDPPPFARSRAALEAAERGYKEINLRAMRLLAPGGHLMTFSCSHHVSPLLFEEICRAAASDADVPLRVIDHLRQAADHPILLAVPETRYLTGLLLQRA
jgi:23S rRNA (cytosine1962-C5)-methyltransferase